MGIKRDLVAFCVTLFVSVAHAQSPGAFSGLTTGVAPGPSAPPLSAAALNAALSQKADVLNGVLASPTLNGGTLNGPFAATGGLTWTADGAQRISLFPVTPTTGDPYTSPDSLALGGQVAGGGSALTIRGQPYGYYDAGTLLSIVNTGLPLTSTRSGINGGFEQGVSAMAGYGFLDEANVFNEIGSVTPPLIVSGVTYDAGNIYMPAGISPTKLRRSMYVMTNSVDASISITPATVNTLPPINTYASTVTGWTLNADGTVKSVQVNGWTVPGSGHATAGQVPSATSPQTVTFGSPTNQFAFNAFMVNNPAANPGSQTHTFQFGEVDMVDFGTVDYATNWRGLTIAGVNPQGIVPAANGVPAHNVLPTADSYDILLAGTTPTYLKMKGGVPGSWNIDGDSFRLAAFANTGAAVGSQATLTDQQFLIDNNIAHLDAWSQRDTAAIAGPRSSSIHLGLWFDGAFGTASGSQFAQVVFNPAGNYGGLSLCAASGVCGITLNDAGQLAGPLAIAAGGVDVTGIATFRNAVTAPTLQTNHSYTVSALNSTLPCSTANEGTRASVTDATAPTFLAALSGGGAVHAPAYCNGTAWVAG